MSHRNIVNRSISISPFHQLLSSYLTRVKPAPSPTFHIDESLPVFLDIVPKLVFEFFFFFFPLSSRFHNLSFFFFFILSSPSKILWFGLSSIFLHIPPGRDMRKLEQSKNFIAKIIIVKRNLCNIIP